MLLFADFQFPYNIPIIGVDTCNCIIQFDSLTILSRTFGIEITNLNPPFRKHRFMVMGGFATDILKCNVEGHFVVKLEVT